MHISLHYLALGGEGKIELEVGSGGAIGYVYTCGFLKREKGTVCITVTWSVCSSKFSCSKTVWGGGE